jgi:superfamily II DNA or RNA helicase
VDTILLLRPTQSATVLLNRLGHGLRRAEGKAVLTVMGFIGQQRRVPEVTVRTRRSSGRMTARIHMDDRNAPADFAPCCSQVVGRGQGHSW